MKTCSKCWETKAPEAFYRHCKKADGLRPECKACSRGQQEKWRQENREHVRALNAASRSRNLDGRLQRAKQRYASNAVYRDKKQAQDRARYRADPTAKREQARRWEAENKGRVTELRRAWQSENRGKKLAAQAAHYAKLTDNRVAWQVARQLGIPQDKVTAAMIEIKREQLRLHRLAKEMQQAATTAMKEEDESSR